MQKNRFGSNSNPNSEIIDWRIDQTGQIYLDGPNVFTTIFDYVAVTNERERFTPATINSDGYVKPLLQKILVMPLNFFLLAFQVDKCDEMLIKNISFKLEHETGSHSLNNDNKYRSF